MTLETVIKNMQKDSSVTEKEIASVIQSHNAQNTPPSEKIKNNHIIFYHLWFVVFYGIMKIKY